tara:strand:+ start:1181 stop:1594 length:414 start_codon:yes stop_codon:yes gene_type:complete
LEFPLAGQNALEKSHIIGEECFIDSVSPQGRFAVVFEDDESTGYFYAMEISKSGQAILDALHVYDVNTVLDHCKPSILNVVWSKDGLKAGLMVDRNLQAVFDFSAQKGWCKTGFPPSHGSWSQDGHEWDGQVVNLFS